MSAQALDLRRSTQIVRRHAALLGAVTALGLLGGAGYTVYKPPMLTSETLVVVPYAAGVDIGGATVSLSPAVDSSGSGTSAGYIATQAVIAHSDPVLSGALGDIGGVSLATLRHRVQAQGLTSNVISISAEGRTGAQAQAIANAVTRSYVSYLASASSPVGQVQARVLGPPTPPTGTPLYARLLETAGIGTLAGVLVGAVIALAIGRGDRRLRERDQIADSIGVPVLASVSAEHPRDAAGWARLLGHYEPGAVDAWRLRKALHQLGLAGAGAADPEGSRTGAGPSLAVLSLSSDRRALALGPQFAAFAAATGIPTALVVQQEGGSATATLHAACAAAPPRQPGDLIVTVSDHDNARLPAEAALTIVVAVVDSQDPRVADTMHATTTVLAVSAGAATAEQLARVATSAAAAGRDVAGILVADPDPGDQTTGRMPQVARPGQRKMPARMDRTAMETRR